MTPDVAVAVIGGRGPHGLAFHLWMQDHGLAQDGHYALLDPAPHWLPLYGPDGSMQAVGHLRSPRELDFALGDPQRAMHCYRDPQGHTPLAGVYSLEQAACETFNRSTDTSLRAPRLDFWRYANSIAERYDADRFVLQQQVTKLEPLRDSWRLHFINGQSLTSCAVVLATGLRPHLRIPQPWALWWQHLPATSKAHALKFDYAAKSLQGRKVAVLGSSNIATWEAAIRAAKQGAKVTLLCRAPNPIEWQLPFPPHWFTEQGMRDFMALPSHKRLRLLSKIHIPNSALPGMAAEAEALGVRLCYYARVRYASPLWGGVQLLYKDQQGEQAEYFDLLIAATGATPAIKGLPLLSEVARSQRAPVIVGSRAVKHRPILDDEGRWKNLPPLYPMGAHALMRAGFACATLASASVYLPLTLPGLVTRLGLTSGSRQLAA